MAAAAPSVEQQLRLLLWQLAQRWGRVRLHGVWLPLRLSHETIGQMLGTRRPSITAGVNRLERTGAIRREPGGVWLFDCDLFAADPPLGPARFEHGHPPLGPAQQG